MISHKYKFIYVHIPKCGGTSVEHSLLVKHGIPEQRVANWNLTDEEKSEYRLYYKYGGVDVQHKKIDQYKDKNEKKYFTFTFVRNPWERFVSEYFYIKKTDGCNCENFNSTFPNFKHFAMNDGLKCAWVGHDTLQIDYVFNSNHGKLTNFVGRCEDMQYDFDYVCGKLGLGKLKLPHRNPTKHKHYTEYYDDETRQIVAEKYAKDIEYFGYEFGENT